MSDLATEICLKYASDINKQMSEIECQGYDCAAIIVDDKHPIALCGVKELWGLPVYIDPLLCRTECVTVVRKTT